MRHLSKAQNPATILALVLLIAGAFSTNICSAQSTQQFTGRVLDTTGAVVSGATVVAHNQGTGIDSKTSTTGAGVYTIPYLIPGHTCDRYQSGIQD